MVTAGQDLTLYQKIDKSLASGFLPGGTAPDYSKLGLASTVALGAVGVVGAGAVGYAAYKYFTKDGKQRKIRKDGKPYDKPSMNYANPKALSRAERRLKSYIKHARKHVGAMGYTIAKRK
jgi:hypothetical protein